MAGQPSRVTTYQSYFNKVLSKRLSYLNNINGLLAISVSITLALPYGHFWWNLLLTFIARAPIIFIALVLVKVSRDHNSTVELSRYKTLGEQIIKLLFRKKSIINFILYSISSGLLSVIFIFELPIRYDYYTLSKIYQQKPTINDDWVYFWFYSSYIGVIYTIQHIIFQRNRLQFKYGISKVKPDSVFFKNFQKIFGFTLGLNLIGIFSGPIVYFFIRSVIYKLNWFIILVLGLDSNLPPFKITISTWLNITFLSFHTILLWEIVNNFYDIYSTIGCLDGSKPISTYSSDPINTLLSGLRDVDPDHQLARLTAFQELAYISTTEDPVGKKLRIAIYNAHSKAGFVWPAILDECLLIIKRTASNVNYRTKSDFEALKQTQISIKDDLNRNLLKNEDDIFGNSSFLGPTTPRNLDANASPSSLKKYEETTIKTENKNIFTITENLYSSFIKSGACKFVDLQVLAPIKSFFVTSFESDGKQPSLNIIGKTVAILQQNFSIYQRNFYSTPIGRIFRINVQRDANSRIINPVNYGNAVISITNLLIHAIEEDKNDTITNAHISEVLNLLERPIRAFANYTDVLPASVHLTPQERQNGDGTRHHLIALLHDLTISEFYKLCVKYNYKLNDLVLSARAFKLAKWVIDVALAQQQEQQQQLSKAELRI